MTFRLQRFTITSNCVQYVLLILSIYDLADWASNTKTYFVWIRQDPSKLKIVSFNCSSHLPVERKAIAVPIRHRKRPKNEISSARFNLLGALPASTAPNTRCCGAPRASLLVTATCTPRAQDRQINRVAERSQWLSGAASVRPAGDYARNPRKIAPLPLPGPWIARKSEIVRRKSEKFSSAR